MAVDEGNARANFVLLMRRQSLIGSISIKRRKKGRDSIVDEFLEEDDEGLGSKNVHAPPDVRARAHLPMRGGACGVCSACRAKLEATGNGNCHVCRTATRGYRRCHAMERLVDCIRVPCPYAAHGCDATPPYHGQEIHRQACPHAPCHCPGDSCGFIGSTAALLDHFAGAHDWPCTSKARAGETLCIRLRVGFNLFLLADHDRGNGDQTSATGSVPYRLFLLNVVQERLGRAISVLCIHPHANSVDQPPSMICKLAFSHSGDMSLCRMHCQSSEFKVVCTDLSNGLPSPDGCLQFIVPNAVLGDDNKDYIEVKVRISIN